MFKVYVSKAKTKPLDIKANFERAQAEIDAAKNAGAKLVVFPQGFLTGVQLGILSDAIYLRTVYEQMAAQLSQNNPDIYILCDVYRLGKWENRICFGGKMEKGDEFEIEGVKFVSFNSAQTLREKAADIYADCIILNESAPVIAGSRALLHRLLTAVAMGTGRTVVACLGGHGFTSHPDAYLPASGCINARQDYFTKTLPEFTGGENIFEIEKGAQGNRMLYNLPRLDFDLAFNQNPLIPCQLDEKEYCLDLFHLQSDPLRQECPTSTAKLLLLHFPAVWTAPLHCL